MRVESLSDSSLTVTFVLSERHMITDIILAGYHSIPKKEMKDALGFTNGVAHPTGRTTPAVEPFDKSEWDARLANLLLLYKKYGYFAPSVKVRFQADQSDPLKKVVRLDIQEGQRARIKKIVFTGHYIFSYRSLYLAVWSRPPEYFRAKRLEEDLERLLLFYKERGYRMASVGPPQIDFLSKSGEVDIIIPIMASIRTALFFHGFGRVNQPLDRFVQINTANGDSIAVLEASARAMEDHYRGQGYPFATVTVEVKLQTSQIKEIHFTMQGMTRARIRAIQFKGNRAFSDERLRKFVQIKKEGIFTKTDFTQEHLQEDTERLVSFYKQNGFQSVEIKPIMEFEKKKWAVLIFHVGEGTQTMIGKIVISGARHVASHWLLALLSIHPNDPYNKGVVREGEGQILAALSRLGYIDAKVDSTVIVSDDQTDAEVHYQLLEGEPVFFGTLNLFGNKKTRDRIILREIMIQTGDPYDDEKILESQKRLNKTGLFSGILFDPIRHADHPATQDMNLTVVEQPSLTLEFGPGYGDREGARGFLEVGHRNLFGTGRKIFTRAIVSEQERQYSLNYKEHHTTPRDMDFTFGGTYFRIPRKSFNEKALVGTLGGEIQLSSSWKSALFYQYEDKEISDVTPGVQLTAQDVGRLIIGSINPSLLRDTRDNLLNPKSGSVFGVTLRTAAKRMGSEVQMIKITQQGNVFFSRNGKMTLALSARIGIAERFGETQVIPLSERFFLGGRSTVRGYAHQTLGIEGETVINGQPTGGNAMLIFNEELRLHLSDRFGIVFFIDHGNVWRELSNLALHQLKSTSGIGIRYNTPVGPLRIDRGYKLDREGSESSGEYHFTLGHAF